MIQLPFEPLPLSGDAAIKKDTATKQMTDLCTRIQSGHKYRMLTKSDRQTLHAEGYAPDLVNNVVFITQRIRQNGLGGESEMDEIVVGFTYAAFDPSIYASNDQLNHYRKINRGCCAFCESYIDANGGGIYHIKPASVICTDAQTMRSPYYALAYEQNNLVYSCTQCSEHYKQNQFPQTSNGTDSKTDIMVNPYLENPRDFIRFNPLSGAAYPYDSAQKYVAEHYDLKQEESEQYLLDQPQNIPDQNDNAFSSWLNHQDSGAKRGSLTIDLLGLNRPSLVYLRKMHIASYLLDQAQTPPSNIAPDTIEGPYKSLTLDLVRSSMPDGSAQSQDAQPHDPIQNIQNRRLPTHIQAAPVTDSPQVYADWICSSLMYIVLESELTLKNKRRVVSLNHSDKFYGGDSGEKCVFLSINWEKEGNNVVKVNTGRTVWESTLQELSDSRPLEIAGLFKDNEIWAEGQYDPLA